MIIVFPEKIMIYNTEKHIIYKRIYTIIKTIYKKTLKNCIFRLTNIRYSAIVALETKKSRQWLATLKALGCSEGVGAPSNM